mgnify:CR=1 FL=1
MGLKSHNAMLSNSLDVVNYTFLRTGYCESKKTKGKDLSISHIQGKHVLKRYIKLSQNVLTFRTKQLGVLPKVDLIFLQLQSVLG